MSPNPFKAQRGKLPAQSYPGGVFTALNPLRAADSKAKLYSQTPIGASHSGAGGPPFFGLPRGSSSALCQQTHLSDKPDPHPFQSLTIGREGQSRWAERESMYQGGGAGGGSFPSLPTQRCYPGHTQQSPGDPRLVHSNPT